MTIPESQLTQKDGRLMSQNNYFAGDWLSGSLMDLRWGGEETKLNCHLIPIRK